MSIVLISGSVRSGSTTTAFLHEMIAYLSQYTCEIIHDLDQLPVYHPDRDDNPYHDKVTMLKTTILQSNVVIICTPEYTHNIPAILKNALEWLTKGGELSQKKVIALTYTPHAPRGSYAMTSLIQTIKALDAHILLQEQLYHTGSVEAVAEVIQELIQ